MTSADRQPAFPLLPMLQELSTPLYALLDCARDPAIRRLLRASASASGCLFEGAHAETLSDHAPYLVCLTPDDPLLRTLVRQGWGQCWGVYLTCDRPFEELLEHLRRRCWVRDPGGAKLYFRFFDPRVMRTALAAMDQRELSGFLGPVLSFMAEGDTPETLLCFNAEPDGVRLYRIGVVP